MPPRIYSTLHKKANFEANVSMETQFDVSPADFIAYLWSLLLTRGNEVGCVDYPFFLTWHLIKAKPGKAGWHGQVSDRVGYDVVCTRMSDVGHICIKVWRGQAHKLFFAHARACRTPKKRRISSLAERLMPSQEGVWSVELVSWLISELHEKLNVIATLESSMQPIRLIWIPRYLDHQRMYRYKQANKH
jgi:hypothetical protein